MAVHICAVVLLVVILVILLRGGHLRLRPALAAVAFGFFLASAGAAPAITAVFTAVANAVHGITF
ncbi:hypothetical protein [Streptomyces yaizuensis]|uniref:DUF2304 domain-containing protein n=1 Tax=Streptomyces yaizuensis TaxID=2989713 RepID=A0ABQ5P6U4_9ACTN|nr:hypothetical protein [Streptomyces sp. YSPA8]GLF98195.1 hypothetical protein SYYSPA8_27880 [Streptomyces sp. YSPA8]